MKKLALLAVFGLLTLGTYAQKIGHVFADQVLSELKIKDQVQEKLKIEGERLNNLLSEYQNKFQDDVAEFESKIQEYQTGESKYTKEELEMETLELQSAEKNLQTIATKFQEDFKNFEENLILPLTEKVRNAISIVAEKEKYTYIFAREVIHYAKEENHDITDKVKKELGL